MSTSHTPPDIPIWRRNLAVVALISTALISTMDASMVNVALPVLSQKFGAASSDVVWVATAYLLATACGIPAAAALGDQVGRKRLFLVGMPWFTLSTFGVGMSTTLPMLIAFRTLQGLGSAVILGVGLPVLRWLFPPARLGTVFGINAMVVALGTCIGPTIGGLILSVTDWQWLFRVTIPIGIISLCLGAYAIPQQKAQPGHFDWLGSILSGTAIVAFLLGTRCLAEISTLWLAGVLFAVCALLVVGFLRQERRAVRPIIPLPMWNGLFSLSVTTASCSFLSQGIAFVALPFLFQSAYGATPLESALLFTPWPAVIMLIAPISGRLADRIRPAILAVTGLCVYLAGFLVLATLGDRPSTGLVLFATGLAGLGYGIFQSPNNREMQLAAPMRYASSAAAVLHLNRNVATSTGTGIVSVTLVLSGAASGLLADEARAAMNVLWVAVITTTFAIVLSVLRLRKTLRSSSDG